MANAPLRLDERAQSPPLRAGLVSRNELTYRLSLSTERVVCIVAPPGYGKTTLVNEWIHHDDRPTARVSLSADSEDPVLFVAELADVLDGTIDVDPRVGQGLGAPFPNIASTVVLALISSIAHAEFPFLLVIDDAHHLGEECMTILLRLIHAVPQGSQVVIVARREPEPGLPRLRVAGEVLDLGMDDLRLSADEARGLLDASGAEFASQEIDDLIGATEGWATGLYLAALARRDGGAGASSHPPVSGDERLLADYIRQEVLRGLPEERVAFLTRTAILPELTGALCDAVLDISGSAAVLEDIERSNLLLVPLDDHRERYRYHHLFRDLLRHELNNREPGKVAELHRRASAAFEAMGMTERAIDHAMAAADVERVEVLVASEALNAYRSGRMATMRRWLAWLEREGTTDTGVAVLAAWIHGLDGDSPGADRWAEIAERGADGPLPDGSASADAWRGVLRAYMVTQGPARAAADAQLSLQLLAGGSQWIPTARIGLAMAKLAMGDVDEADTLLEVAVDEARQMSFPPAVVLSLAERAWIASTLGRRAEAEVFSNQALAAVRAHRLDGYVQAAVAFATSANAALRRGDVEGAWDALAQAEQLRPSLTYSFPLVAVQVRLELAEAYLSLEEAGSVQGCIDESVAVLRRRGDLGTFAPRVQGMEDRLADMREGLIGRERLTNAERRLLPLLAEHGSFREIGEVLHLSPHTIKSQAISVYRKLGVSARSDAVIRAQELSLLPPA